MTENDPAPSIDLYFSRGELYNPWKSLLLEDKYDAHPRDQYAESKKHNPLHGFHLLLIIA
jgi:hypothetical protein